MKFDRTRVSSYDKEYADKRKSFDPGSSGKQIDSDRHDSKYVPYFESPKLPGDRYPDKCFNVRLLPGLDGKDWVYTVYSYKFSYVFGQRFHNLHSPITLDPKAEDPIAALRKQLYEVQSEKARNFANKLWHKPTHYMNVVCRMVQLLDDKGQKKWFRNCGPKVLSLPDKVMKDIVWPAWEDEEIGDPTNLDSGFDLKLHCEKIQCEQGIFPRWDRSKFSRKITPAGSDEDIDYWMTNLYSLEEEYQPCTMKELTRTADMLYDLYMGRDASRNVKVDGNKPSDEDGDDEEEAPRPRKPASRDDDEEAPRSRKPASRDDDEEEAPRSRKPAPKDDDEEEAPRSRRSTPKDDEEEEAPRSRKPAPKDDEEEEAPRSRKPTPKNDEEEEAPRSRKPTPKDDEEEEAPRSRKPAPKDEEEPPRKTRSRVADDDEEAPKKPKSKGDDEASDGDDDWFDRTIGSIPKK